MDYVYRRTGGLFEVRYPIPDDLRGYFPKKNSTKFRTHLIQSLGTRDQSEANGRARELFLAFEKKFALLRDGVASPEFRTFCHALYKDEIRDDAERRLHEQPDAVVRRNERAQINFDSLNNRSVEALEAHVGGVVDLYLESDAKIAAVVPKHSELRTALLTAAADVMQDILWGSPLQR